MLEPCICCLMTVGKVQAACLRKIFGKFKQGNEFDAFFGFSTMIDCSPTIGNIEWALEVLCVPFVIILKKILFMSFKISHVQ